MKRSSRRDMNKESLMKQRRWKSELIIAESPELVDVDSPSARFKSNYAKEVVQYVRHNKNLSGRHSHPGYVYKSQSELRIDDYPEERDQMYRSRSNCDLMSLARKNVHIQAELPSKDDHLAWMSATTFKRILDKQEEAELNCNSCGSRKAAYKKGMPVDKRCSENNVDLLKNMNKVRDILNLDVREEHQWTNVCSIIEQKKMLSPNSNGNNDIILSSQMVVRNENGNNYIGECLRLKEQNELLSSEIHDLRKQIKTDKYYENEVENLRNELKSMEKKSESNITPSLKNPIKMKRSQSTSINPQINRPSLNESDQNDSSLPVQLDLSRNDPVFTSPLPSSKSKKYYENIEVFESLYKDTLSGQEWNSMNKTANNDISEETSPKIRFERRRSFKHSAAFKNKISNSTLALDESKNLGKPRTHKIMRSVKWFLAKEKSLKIAKVRDKLAKVIMENKDKDNPGGSEIEMTYEKNVLEASVIEKTSFPLMIRDPSQLSTLEYFRDLPLDNAEVHQQLEIAEPEAKKAKIKVEVKELLSREKDRLLKAGAVVEELLRQEKYRLQRAGVAVEELLSQEEDRLQRAGVAVEELQKEEVVVAETRPLLLLNPVLHQLNVAQKVEEEEEAKCLN
ncbi:unnamed protein product [Lepeophtheirus salmonis]|uniref:(salmon louse) hypothetical protein n=1 Tax=Lepeophtheirus salmonis TaxID=72036 RepID=A0A7R8CWW6_LEPSM|nr:unnamed protein product [Lepeophtheirus salmonis]CAF2955325.1 unnamed protein product [Lepeophtheirus salmonis]